MNDQKIIIESLAMDLKRVAIGMQRGSYGMAVCFKKEALKRIQELESGQLNNYLEKLIINLKKSLSKDNEQEAEDALMYSTLFQNYSLKNSA